MCNCTSSDSHIYWSLHRLFHIPNNLRMFGLGVSSVYQSLDWLFHIPNNLTMFVGVFHQTPKYRSLDWLFQIPNNLTMFVRIYHQTPKYRRLDWLFHIPNNLIMFGPGLSSDSNIQEFWLIISHPQQFDDVFPRSLFIINVWTWFIIKI